MLSFAPLPAHNHIPTPHAPQRSTREHAIVEGADAAGTLHERAAALAERRSNALHAGAVGVGSHAHGRSNEEADASSSAPPSESMPAKRARSPSPVRDTMAIPVLKTMDEFMAGDTASVSGTDTSPISVHFFGHVPITTFHISWDQVWSLLDTSDHSLSLSLSLFKKIDVICIDINIYTCIYTYIYIYTHV